MEAVKGSGVEVYMDGGVRTGTDVFKALGRGARAVFVGRPILWGLACEVHCLVNVAVLCMIPVRVRYVPLSRQFVLLARSF